MYRDLQITPRCHFILAYRICLAARRVDGNTDEVAYEVSAYRQTRTTVGAAEASVKETAAVYAELRVIEKDISDMCELMGQLRDMVERNGEMVDQIEAWVAQDLEHVKVRARRRTAPLVVSP